MKNLSRSFWQGLGLSLGSVIIISACSLGEDKQPALKSLNATIQIVEPAALLNSSLSLHEIDGILSIDDDERKKTSFRFRDGVIDPIPLVLTEGPHTFKVDFDLRDGKYGHVILLTSNKIPMQVDVNSADKLLFLDDYTQPDADNDEVSNLEEVDFDTNPYDSNEAPSTNPIRVKLNALRFSNPVTQGMTVNWEPARHKLYNVNLEYQLVFSFLNNINTILQAQVNGTPYGGWSLDTFANVINKPNAHTMFWNVLVRDNNGNENVYAPARPNGMGVIDLNFSSNNDGFLNIATTITKQFGSEAMDVSSISEGIIYVAGRELTSASTSTTAIWAFQENGGTFSTFAGGKGMKLLPNPNGIVSDDIASAIALDNNGKLLVTGKTGASNTDNSHNMILWRLFVNGSIDTNFGNNLGYVISDSVKGTGNNLSELGSAITVDNAGNILVAGSAQLNSLKTVLAVWRYDNNGNLDTSFGNGKGYITHNGLGNTTNTPNSRGQAIAVDANGNIIVAGFTTNANNNTDLAVWKFNNSGSPVAGFGSNNSFTIHDGAAGGNLNDAGHALSIDNSNRIVVTGMSQSSATTQSMVVWRFLQDGQLDPSFANNNGYLLYTIPSGSAAKDSGNSVILDSQENIIIAGAHSNTTNTDMAIWRFTPDGILDTSYGPGTGYVTHNNASLSNSQSNDVGNAITINSKGMYIVSGSSQELDGVSTTTVWQYQ